MAYTKVLAPRCAVCWTAYTPCVVARFDAPTSIWKSAADVVIKYTFSRSKGAVAVRDTMPATPPSEEKF
jgi:hypothetical protein